MIPKTNGRSKDIRHYVGAVGIFSLVIGLLVFLSLKQIPAENKDIFVSIVGMIVGSLSVVIYAVIGKNPDEVAELQKKNQSLQSLCDQMEKRNDQLEAMIIKIQEDIIEKLTVLGASAFDTIYHKKK
jgi:ABC-type enterochelin transport system permease subunit|tara:strand:- start:1247 stop:1627 length:381 start_codon:yes stop_codon:yes gene_type:complete